MGAMAEKCGTHPAILRSSPAADAATWTGLVRTSLTRTARCGHRVQASAPHRENAGCPLRAKQRHCSVPTASPMMPSGSRDCAGVMAISIWPSARSSSEGSRGATHSTATPGASDLKRARRSANIVCMKSDAATRKTRRELGGSKICRGDSTRCIPRSSGRACSSRSSAKVVGCIRTPALINKGSLSCWRSRDSEWLTADCVRPSRSAARVTLRSIISTSNTTSRLRSKRLKSISFMIRHNYSFDR
jgi:hypothetical protein